MDFAIRFGVVTPPQLAGGGVNGVDDSETATEIQRAVDLQRRCFQRVLARQLQEPIQRQSTHGLVVDLLSAG